MAPITASSPSHRCPAYSGLVTRAWPGWQLLLVSAALAVYERQP